MLKDITVSPAPHISKPMSTRSVMLDVIIGLSPAIIAALWFFRMHAVVVIGSCVVACVVTEFLCNLMLKRANPLESIGDLSAVVTGIILAFSVTPFLPFWAAIVGSVFAIAIAKMAFGGLGANIFNPAMAGRAFLMLSFPVMTMWALPGTIDSSMPTIGPSENYTDARTQATPLSLSKDAIKAKQKVKQSEVYIAGLETKIETAPAEKLAKLESELQEAKAGQQAALEKAKKRSAEVNDMVGTNFLGSLVTGEVGGCVGETSALALIIGGIYLLIRKTISIHIPLAVIISTLICGLIANLVDPDAYITPLAHVFGGGLLIGAFFIATDPVTAPLSTKGMWIFGAGVGIVTMLIRIIGGYPEGMMFSILVMNSVTPLIDRMCKLVPAGGKPNV